MPDQVEAHTRGQREAEYEYQNVTEDKEHPNFIESKAIPTAGSSEPTVNSVFIATPSIGR